MNLTTPDARGPTTALHTVGVVVIELRLERQKMSKKISQILIYLYSQPWYQHDQLQRSGPRLLVSLSKQGARQALGSMDSGYYGALLERQ